MDRITHRRPDAQLRLRPTISRTAWPHRALLYAALLLFAGVDLLSKPRLHVEAFDSSQPPQLPPVFPLGARDALVRKAEGLAQTAGYTAAGFSNRRGLVLTPLFLSGDEDGTGSNGVYAADRPFLWNSIDVMGRMVIIELPKDGTSKVQNAQPDLWVHSPVALDGPLKTAIDSLGIVRHIVAPNYEHVKYAGQWKQAYPAADAWACPGLADREPQVTWSGEVLAGYRPASFGGGPAAVMAAPLPPGMWDAGAIETLQIDVEVNPFTGKPFFNECIFYHRPSKSLITTDLFWNYPASGVPNAQFGRDDSWELAPTVPEVPWSSRLWKFGMDKIYLPFYENFMVQNRDAYQTILHHILDVWDVEMVVPAHGDVLRGKPLVRQALTQFFGYDK